MTTDNLTNSLGKPGKFQVLLYFYLASHWFYLSWNHLGMAFMGAKTKHHCTVANSTDVSRLVPLKTKKGKSEWDGCHLYDGYNSSKKIPCPNGWTYELPQGEATVVSEWDLVCDDAYKVNLATTVYFVGVTLGTLVFGTLSDRFGRRPVLLTTMFVPIVLGILLFFINNYVAFVVLRFFLGFVLQGQQIATYTSIIEIFATQYRTVAGVGIGYFWGTGMMLFALFSFLIKDWQYIQLMSTTVCLYQIGLIWFLPESIRWLLIKNRFGQAEKVVRKIGAFNNIPFPQAEFDKAVNEIENTRKSEEKNDNIKSYTIADIYRSSLLRKRSLIMMVVWFSTSLGYFGLTFNISNLAGNKYLNFFISGALEIVILTLTVFILKRYGRRKPLFAYSVNAGCILVIAGVLPKSSKKVQTVVTALAIVGRMFVTGNFANVFVYTSELYPTTIRNVGLGAGIFWARIGGIVAPQILSLGIYTAEAVPFIIFGAMYLLSSVLVLLLQETLNLKLPETIEEARHIKLAEREIVEEQNIELVSKNNEDNDD